MPSAAVYDTQGERLTPDERAFFRDADPWGFIVFGRHCASPDALRAHCAELRDCVGRNAPILVDQEGGRVARLRAPAFREHHPPAVLGALWRLDRVKARQAARQNAKLLGRLVRACGVTVNCAPSLDLPQIDSDPATLGDRALAMHPDIVCDLGAAYIEGALEGGVLPVVKHLPGLGRARCDSHKTLPRVEASLDDLDAHDFAPFRALADAPAGMSAHVVYEAFDAERPATISPTVITGVIRGSIGFDGLLFTDDLKMEALSETYGERAEKALEAGCDIALLCNLSLAEKRAAARHVPSASEAAMLRTKRAFEKAAPFVDGDDAAEFAELAALLKPALA